MDKGATLGPVLKSAAIETMGCWTSSNIFCNFRIETRQKTDICKTKSFINPDY